ncbi:MAG: MFS transporter [Proteobacteria bacterium]|nr:MFS transporter [Pseudomonadota bacterium]MBI3500117.1 MFS transporter [Pseudomonadota bacterium]
MLARRFAALLAGHDVHYAWVVVAVTFLTTLTTAGAVGIPGALILPLTQEFGWDTAEISSALALRLLLFGLMAPFAAALIERYGVRRVVVAAVVLIVVGLAGALVMTRVWHLVLAWGLIVGIGTGMIALVLSAIVSNRWFSQRRGLVIGLLTASSATGQLVFLPLAASLAASVGWRAALVPPLGALMLAALLVVLFLRDRPSDVGLAAFGDTGPAPPPPSAPPQAAIRRAFQVLAEASASPVFWILFATFFICGLSTNGLIQTHFIPLCADFGLAPVAGATVLAAMGIFDIIGTIGSGWLSDRVDPRKLLFWYYGLRGLSLLYLPSSSFSLYGLSLFAVFYGLDWIATVPPTVKIAATVFGRERAGIVFGWVFTAHQLGAATAAFGAGLSRTLLETYLPAFYLAGAACLLAAVLALGARSSQRPAALA